MSFRRQPALTPGDERFLLVRTMVVRCDPGVQTSSPTQRWHRLIAAGEGVMIVRTPQGAWSTPSTSAVWVPAGVRADLEMCTETTLRMLYLRQGARGRRNLPTPKACCAVGVSPLLREIIARISAQPALDSRIPWHVSLAELVHHEVREGARTPHELVWPRDPRAARIAAILQSVPGDQRRLPALCRGQGVSPRTIQRLFPDQTGLTFDQWRLRLRFLHASRLLADHRKVSDVAHACGYNSVSAFVAAFRKLAGVTPGEFCRGAVPAE